MHGQPLNVRRYLAIAALALVAVSCSDAPPGNDEDAAIGGDDTSRPAVTAAPDAEAAQAPGGADVRADADRSDAAEPAFQVETERFADVRILRYRVPGFDELDLRTKTLLYYLYEAALSGREIVLDQKYRYNLAVKRTLEQILREYPGDRTTDDFEALVQYAKRVWFSNGIHHHYAYDKFVPGFDYAAFEQIVRATPGPFPVRDGQSLDDLLAELRPVIFDAGFDAKMLDKRAGIDAVEASAVNYYSGVTQQEAEQFYAERRDPADPTPVSYGINSRLVKTESGIVERVWKVGGLYTEAIEPMVAWLERAIDVAEDEAQRDALEKLVEYYRTGDLEVWDEYNIAWVEDTEWTVDVISGFVEFYHDPLSMRGSFESIVQVQDPVATRRIEALASEAQWFEDNAPIRDEHKKADVRGITANVINVVVEAGDASPYSYIGVNLPNADWIRKEHGSKSVTLGNIVAANDLVRGGAEAEFAWDAAEIERGRLYGEQADALRVDMHEVLGHASGQLNPGVGSFRETLRNYGSTLEEARADLFALYYMIDPKLVELGLLPSAEAGHIAYDRYIRNGLMMQLNRIEPGNDIEEDHMRNRQLVASWAYERGLPDNVIERRERDGKTYFVIENYARLRELFGELLRELQRIKSEGDYAAIQALVETYGVEVDPELHAEVLERYAALDLPAFSGYINPRLVPVERDGEIVDVRIEYPDDFSEQMLEYADEYAFLPAWN